MWLRPVCKVSNAPVCSTSVLCLNRIPLMLAVDRISSPQLGGSIRTAQDIIRSNEGAVTALYRGLMPNIVGNSVSWALYFVCYDKLKNGLQIFHGRGSLLSYYDFFLASGAAGKYLECCPKAAFLLIRSTRNFDCGLHKPHMGDQNSHAVNILYLSWRVQFHHRRDTADLPFRRAAGVLSWFGPFPLRCFPWCFAVHGLRRAEVGPRRRHHRAAARTWQLRPFAP